MQLEKQTYGVRMNCAAVWGTPSGVWLECTNCDESQRIVGSQKDPHSIDNKEASKIFRSHGWTGKGHKMTNALCPKCSSTRGMI